MSWERRCLSDHIHTWSVDKHGQLLAEVKQLPGTQTNSTLRRVGCIRMFVTIFLTIGTTEELVNDARF
eukprot:6481660-Amphidinium_carterae.1